MDPLAVAHGYFDAWNACDPAAIASTFAPGGTYTDPNLPEGVDAKGTPSTPAASLRRFPTSISTSRASG